MTWLCAMSSTVGPTVGPYCRARSQQCPQHQGSPPSLAFCRAGVDRGRGGGEAVAPQDPRLVNVLLRVSRAGAVSDCREPLFACAPSLPPALPCSISSHHCVPGCSSCAISLLPLSSLMHRACASSETPAQRLSPAGQCSLARTEEVPRSSTDCMI